MTIEQFRFQVQKILQESIKDDPGVWTAQDIAREMKLLTDKDIAYYLSHGTTPEQYAFILLQYS